MNKKPYQLWRWLPTRQQWVFQEFQYRLDAIGAARFLANGKVVMKCVRRPGPRLIFEDGQYCDKAWPFSEDQAIEDNSVNVFLTANPRP